MSEASAVHHYDLCYLKDQGDGKTHWITIGRGYPSDHGRISVTLDALPVPMFFSGRVMLYPKNKDGSNIE